MPRWCEVGGCGSRTTFGPPGAGSNGATHCHRHCPPGLGYQNVVAARCAADGCSTLPSFGQFVAQLRGKPTHCHKHRLPGHRNVRKRWCVADGCEAAAVCGPPTPSRATHCLRHRPPGYQVLQVVGRRAVSQAVLDPQVLTDLRVAGPGKTGAIKRGRAGGPNVGLKLCVADGCLKQPSYGPPGADRGDATYCLSHSFRGYLPARGIYNCQTNMCATIATFAMIGTNQAVYCARHRPAGYFSIQSRQCAHPECAKCPSFGPPGGNSKDAVYCVRHRLGGHLNIVSRRCKVAGCSETALYGPQPGEKMRFGASRVAPVRCLAHRRDVDTLHKNMSVHGRKRKRRDEDP